MVLQSLHRLSPQALRFLCIEIPNGISVVLRQSGMVTIAPYAFPGLPIFLRRQFNWTSLVRLSDPCVSGGSTTSISLSLFLAPLARD
jgi:hypothetical protein